MMPPIFRTTTVPPRSGRSQASHAPIQGLREIAYLRRGPEPGRIGKRLKTKDCAPESGASMPRASVPRWGDDAPPKISELRLDSLGDPQPVQRLARHPLERQGREGGAPPPARPREPPPPPGPRWSGGSGGPPASRTATPYPTPSGYG